MNILDDEKETRRNKFEINSRYKRHTGPSLYQIQRWTTRERHWRRMGDIEKKKNNIQRRKQAHQEINEKINISKPYKYRKINNHPLYRANPVKFIPNMFEKINRKELNKKYLTALTAEHIYNQKYINTKSYNKNLDSHNFISTISNIDYCNEQMKTTSKIVLDNNLIILDVITTKSWPEEFNSFTNYPDIIELSQGDKIIKVDDIDVTELERGQFLDYLHKLNNSGYVNIVFERSGRNFIIYNCSKKVFFR